MNGKLEIIVFNVELGNAIWLSSPSGKNMMFDIGRRSDFSPLQWVRKNKTSVLHALVITHPHVDHFDDIGNLGLFNLHSFYRPCHLSNSDVIAGNLRNGVLQKEDLVKMYFGLCVQFNPIYAPNSTMACVGDWSWNDGMVFEVFQPHLLSKSNLNNHSLVTFVSFNGVTIMLPGDCESCAWNELLKDQRFIARLSDVNVLVAPHHGRDSSYSADLMANMNPDVCVISDGHAPATAVTSKYDYHCKPRTYKIRGAYQSGRKCLSTRHDGDIFMTVGGGGADSGRYEIFSV